MKLADYLKQHDLDDASFAAKVGCDRSTIYRIRKGETKPSDPLKEAIAKETGGLVQPNDYFDGLPEAEAA
jgi:transcriptional regulator with XRE-family HTH domain